MKEIVNLPILVLAGALLGLALGALPGFVVALWSSLVLIITIVMIGFLLFKLLSKHRYLLTSALFIGFVPGLLVSFAFVYGLHEGEGNPGVQHLYPQLYDDCKELRYNLSCDRYDLLSKALSSLRCGDISFMSIKTQELKPRYIDLMQQCHGG